MNGLEEVKEYLRPRHDFPPDVEERLSTLFTQVRSSNLPFTHGHELDSKEKGKVYRPKARRFLVKAGS
jgi:hypothetical protein